MGTVPTGQRCLKRKALVGVNPAFVSAVEAAGVMDLRVRVLRLTFTPRVLRTAGDEYTVSKLLRHASITMTERYAHLSRGELGAAANKKPLSE